MPAMLAARLYRVLPLLAILAIIGIVVYVFMSWRYTPARAKEAVIKIFIALNGGLSILFALATLYAWIESNSSLRVWRPRSSCSALRSSAAGISSSTTQTTAGDLPTAQRSSRGNRKPVKRYKHLTGFKRACQASMNPRWTHAFQMPSSSTSVVT